MSPDDRDQISDDEFDARFRERVERLDRLIPASVAPGAPMPGRSAGVRGPTGLGTITFGVGLIVVLIAIAGLWKQTHGGSVTPTETLRRTPASTGAVEVDCGPVEVDLCAKAVAVAEGTFPPNHRPFIAVRIEAPTALKTCPPSGGPMPGLHVCAVIVTVTTGDGPVDVGLLRSGDTWVWAELIF